MYYYHAYFDLILFAPAAQGFRPEGEIPRRHSSNSLCLNRGREESVGNDDVSPAIVCARKYEMVKVT